MNKNIISSLIIIGGTCAGSASAFELRFGDFAGRVDNSFSLGTAMRLEDQDPRLIGIGNVTSEGVRGQAFSTNGDDGNLAFEKGDLTSAAAKLTTELSLGRGDWGLQVGGTYVFDAVLNDHDFFQAEDYAGPPTRSSTAADLERRRERLQGRIGNDGDLLNANIYGGFELGDRWVSLRVGRQVVNWGESVFVLNGINSFLSVDAAKVRVPGVKLDEVFLPAGMAWLSASVTENISFEAFYQFEWVATQADPAGSFFSSTDFAGYGAEVLEIAFGRCAEHVTPVTQGGQCAAAPGGTSAPRAPDVEPDDGGQGGFSLRGFLDAWGGIDWGLYAVNYHSRLPLASGTATAAGFEGVPATANYFLEYPEDIQLFGASFNTMLPVFGGLSFQGEYSLKRDQPLQLDGVEVVLAAMRVPVPTQLGPMLPGEYVRGWRRHDVHQLDFSVASIMGPGLLGQDQSLLLVEVAAMQVQDLPDPAELAYEAPATDTPSNPLTVALLNGSAAVTSAATGLPLPQDIEVNSNPYAEDFSWGFRVAGQMTYNNVLDIFSISPTLYYAQDVSGTSPGPIANFIEGRKELRLAVGLDYLLTYSMRLAYTRYFGADNRNALQDRDNLALSFEFAF